MVKQGYTLTFWWHFKCLFWYCFVFLHFVQLGYAWVCWFCQQPALCMLCVMLLWVAQQCYSLCVSSSHLLNLWGLRFSQQCCWGFKFSEPFGHIIGWVGLDVLQDCIVGWVGLDVLQDCTSSAASWDCLGLEDGGSTVLCNSGTSDPVILFVTSLKASILSLTLKNMST